MSTERIRLVVIIGAIVLVIAAGVFAWMQWGKETDEPKPLTAEAAALREFKEKWKVAIKEEGGETAYATFLEEAPKVDIDTHDQAHAFGEALYEVEGLPGLKACDSSYEFGCYHSFFGAAVYEKGIEMLPQFGEACKSKYGNLNLPCEHGIGHGVLVYTDYNKLEKALELCETINTDPTGGCSSGVFMEYNFHTMNRSTEGSYLREATDNAYEPCDALPERFQPSCYFEQIQWWQNIYEGDFKKIGELCSVLPYHSAQYFACYNGAGNYAAAQSMLELEGTVQLCAEMPDEESKALCHEGASWLMMGDPVKKEDAPKLCNSLNEPFQSQCTRKLNPF